MSDELYRGVVRVKRPNGCQMGRPFGAFGKDCPNHLDEKNNWVKGQNSNGFGQHGGTDWLTPLGTIIFCGVDGIVLRSGWQDDEDHMKGFGLRLMIGFEQDKKPYTLFYGHMRELFVEKDDHVKIDFPLGKTGNTGQSTGPHCHIEVRGNDGAVPIEWI